MNFAEAAADEDVIDGLRSIEDKILETGQLVTATGDPESDVIVAFLVTDIGNGEALYLVIDVTTALAVDEDSDVWIDLNDYVYSKYVALFQDLPRNVASVLEESAGQLTRVNGKAIFLFNW